MIIHKTPAFDKKFKKLTNKQKEDFYKAIRFFCNDPHHPSLKTHKLAGKWKSFWALRLNFSDRCIFYFISRHEALLYDVGPHSIYD